jgi:hypothetical protein
MAQSPVIQSPHSVAFCPITEDTLMSRGLEPVQVGPDLAARAARALWVGDPSRPLWHVLSAFWLGHAPATGPVADWRGRRGESAVDPLPAVTDPA